MDYLDFELRIGAGKRSEYEVTVLQAAAGGEPTISANIPIADHEWRRLVDQLVYARGARDPRRSGPAVGEANEVSISASDEALLAREIGVRLFESIIADSVRDAYVSSLARAREEGKGLRLRLRIDAPEVALLPWECLYDPQAGDHVCLLRETPLTRFTALNRDPDVLNITPPLRILGMVATPSELAPLAVNEERARMTHALEHRLDRGDVELAWVEGGTWEALRQALDQGPWHVFHYIGHGDFDPEAGEGLLLFADEHGATQPMPATMLGRLFSGHTSLRLAFLNSCEGGRTSESELFSSVGAVLTLRGVPAVISMQFPITDKAALEFSRLFYDSLARGNPVDLAMTDARSGLSFQQQDGIEWVTPMLHMRAPDGRLFAADSTTVIFDENKPVPIKSAPSAPSRTMNAAARVDGRAPGGSPPRGLEILRRKVYQYWIEGVLESSLFMHALHDLGMEAALDAVESPWGTHVEQPGSSSHALPDEQTLLDVFDEHGGSLLILGEPGSGKTTTMLDLTRRLHQRLPDGSGASGSSPVPVVFNLSSWTPEFPQLEDWLVDQMSIQYQIPRVDGQKLLAAGTILPLLDGLDETAPAVRDRSVEAINTFVLERSLTGLVVCCRLKEYNALPVRLALNTALRLTELTDAQVDDYLNAAGDQLAGLRDLLRRETAMRFDARSPLWLNLMVRAYHGLSIADLAREAEQSAAARRRQLMNDYMDRMYRRARGDGS